MAASSTLPRLETLNRAIANEPSAAVNFMLRGELWLREGFPQRAIEDFQQAIQLARQELIDGEWGYGLQVYIDRAELGIRLANGN